VYIYKLCHNYKEFFLRKIKNIVVRIIGGCGRLKDWLALPRPCLISYFFKYKNGLVTYHKTFFIKKSVVLHFFSLLFYKFIKNYSYKKSHFYFLLSLLIKY
jgi:hypothetical protein